MKLKAEIRLACTILLLCILSNCSSQQKDQIKQPNVLFIIADQFRPDIAGAYGGKEISTPYIDQLAQSGVVFDNAVSTTPVCTPYRGMVLTGNYPTHTGILVNFVNVTSDYYKNTLGELFAKAGYQTGFIGKWHLGAGGWTNYGKEPNGKAGIDRENNFIPPGPGRLGFDYWAAYNFHMQFNNYYYYTNSPEKEQTDQYETNVQVNQAIAFMEKQKNQEHPFFLVLSTHPPHPPFTKEAVPAGYMEKVPEKINWDPNVPEDNPQTEIAMRSYLAMAKNTDDNVGRLLDYLNTSGLDKNTIVVFTSDHGEMHGSHGYLHKQKPYRESLDIPLIYRCPDLLPEGVRKDVPFTPMDHLPTLCELAGIEAPDQKDGISLACILKDAEEDIDRTVLIGNYVSGYNTFTTRVPFLEWRGVFTGKYTYFKWITGKEELYDNEQDSYQLNNLMDDPDAAEIIQILRKKLDELLSEADDDFLPGTEYAKWFDVNRYPKMDVIPHKARINNYSE